MKSTAILVSKNDNYGGNLSHRVKMSLTSLLNTHDEVIFVDWKTINGVGLFEEIKNELPKTGRLKRIQVPYEFLQEYYPEIAKYNIIESIGRNVALRRSSGDWITSTNIDIITNPLDYSSLNPNEFYTVSRRDIDESHHLRYNNFDDLFNDISPRGDSFSPKPICTNSSDKWSLVVCCGDFQIGHRDVWFKMKGFEESILFGCGIDSNTMKKASYYSDIKILNHYIFHLNHGKSANMLDGEIVPPMSNQEDIIQKFTSTTNSDSWGFVNHDLPTEIL